MALSSGLSAAIINPYSDEIMRAYHAYLALSGNDVNFDKYISFVEQRSGDISASTQQSITDLKTAIIKGAKELSYKLTEEQLKSREALDIVNNDIIPALNTVGEGYESKKIYLPGLIMSAEAAGAAFDSIKSHSSGSKDNKKCLIVLASVKGDVHDIGKNIVKLILENYGYEVIDLGKDVPPEKIAETVAVRGAKILGLSALMTTTLPAMADTVSLVKQTSPDCLIMVGGAVLSEEYAKEIGADFYGKDALDAVKFAEKVNNC